MAAFLDKVTLIANALILWVSSLSSWLVADILMGFAISITIFGIVLRIFRKIKKII